MLFASPAVNQLLGFTLRLLEPPSRVDRLSNTQALGALMWELRRAGGPGLFLISPAVF